MHTITLAYKRYWLFTSMFYVDSFPEKKYKVQWSFLSNFSTSIWWVNVKIYLTNICFVRLLKLPANSNRFFKFCSYMNHWSHWFNFDSLFYMVGWGERECTTFSRCQWERFSNKWLDRVTALVRQNKRRKIGGK